MEKPDTSKQAKFKKGVQEVSKQVSNSAIGYLKGPGGFVSLGARASPLLRVIAQHTHGARDCSDTPKQLAVIQGH